MTAETIKQKLSEALPVLKKKYPIESLALFGSVTRDDFDPEKSDIDIMVELNGDMDWDYFDLCEEIMSLYPNKKVDVVSRGAIPGKYWPFIKEDLIYA